MAKKRIKEDPTYEGQLALAIDAVKNKKVNSLRRASRLVDVSTTTLQERVAGTAPLQEAGILRRKMTPTEKSSLHDWVLSLERCGVPPRPRMLQEMANILLTERDLIKLPKKAGVNWVQLFLRRCLDIWVKFARRLVYSRARCEDMVIIQGFFDWLQGHI